jgi:hypothetical protein
MKKLFITLGLITCIFASGQNIMKLSSAYIVDEINIETVEGAVSQSIIDTLYKYRDVINDNDHTKITAVVNNDLSNLLTKCLNRNFDGLTELHIAFAQVVLFHKNDIEELAIRLKNQSLIEAGEYDYETGNQIRGYDVNRNEWSWGVIVTMPQHTDKGNIVVRKNKELRELNQYTIY